MATADAGVDVLCGTRHQLWRARSAAGANPSSPVTRPSVPNSSTVGAACTGWGERGGSQFDVSKLRRRAAGMTVANRDDPAGWYELPIAIPIS